MTPELKNKLLTLLGALDNSGLTADALTVRETLAEIERLEAVISRPPPIVPSARPPAFDVNVVSLRIDPQTLLDLKALTNE